MPKFIDLVGKRFERLTVIRRAPSRGPHSYWVCRCDCGTEKVVRAINLKTGNTMSCGCLGTERRRQVCIDRTVHGHRRRAKRTRAYVVWSNMVQRCTNPNNDAFHNYGGRGITVCDRWREFENFLADMGEPPRGMTIDRIDNGRGYEPNNCRWATYKEQMNNIRYNRLIEFNGETLTLQQWADRLGLHTATLRDRIDKRSWPLAEALTQPASAVRLKNRDRA